MRSVLTVTFQNGKSKRFYYELEENDGDLQADRLRRILAQSALVLRIQDESLEHDDELMIIPTGSIESIRLSLPMKEMRLPEVMFVKRAD